QQQLTPSRTSPTKADFPCAFSQLQADFTDAFSPLNPKIPDALFAPERLFCLLGQGSFTQKLPKKIPQ
ncbi:hypothetical protein, partial [Xenorhabdus szentirmaii]